MGSTASDSDPILHRRRDDPVRGRHLVAAQRIDKGRLIFVERPLLVQQSLSNVREAWVCRACYAFVGDPDEAMRHRFPSASSLSSSSSSSSPRPAVVPCRLACGYAYCSPECERDAWASHHGHLCTGWVRDDGDDADADDHPLVRFKRYAAEANEVLLAAAEWWISQHTAEARRRQRSIDLGGAGVGPDECGGRSRPDADGCPSNGGDVYTDFVMNPWWDVSVLDLLHAPDPGGFAEAIQIQQAQKEICEEAARLLNQALARLRRDRREDGHDEVQGIPPMSAMDVATRLGAFSQNAIGFRSRHPLCRHLFDPDFRRIWHKEIVRAMEHAGFLCGSQYEDGDSNVDEGGAQEGDGEVPEVQCEPDNLDNVEDDDVECDYSQEEVAMLLSQLFVDEDGMVLEIDSSKAGDKPAPERVMTTGDDFDYIFPPFDGTALYATACKMNHSCDPNVIVLFRRSSFGKLHPLVAHCVALRDIPLGEELTISYIENDRPYSDRQLALSSYGFSCACAKCEREAPTLPAGDGSVTISKPSTEASALEEDIFGSDDDGETSETDVYVVEREQSVEHTDDGAMGERALEDVLERLDSRSNHSQHGSVPISIAARLFSYLIQNGASLTRQLGRAGNPAAVDEMRLLSKCVDGSRERDYCLCKVVGCDLECLLYDNLRRRGIWTTPCFREAYWCAVLSGAIGCAHEGSFIESLALLDKGLVLGLPRSHHSLATFVQYVEYHASQMAVGPSLPEVVAVVPDYRRAEYLRAVEEVGLARGIDRAIDERSAPLAFQEFQSAFLVPCKPVLVRGYATRWEALDTMRDLRRLVQDHGHRMVPIEIGSMLSRTRSIDCNDSTMKEEMMTLREFVDSFLVSSVERGVWSLADAVSENPTARVAYMAQHAMMSQIPALCLGLSMHPDLCGPSGPSHVNAWVGTGGTRTPLHFDSYDNLLVQLVGVKYVRLYASGFTNQLPVLMGNSKSSSFGLQGNMSTLNCECEDLDESGPYGEKPTFTYAEALLFPGDCLFIPSRVWHYVRSITTSITINYWFDAA